MENQTYLCPLRKKCDAYNPEDLTCTENLVKFPIFRKPYCYLRDNLISRIIMKFIKGAETIAKKGDLEDFVNDLEKKRGKV